MRKITTRPFPRRIAASLALAAGAALLAPVTAPVAATAATAAAPCVNVPGIPPTGPSLTAVTVLTACSAWATTSISPTIDRWDGASWTAQQLPLPAGATINQLSATAGTSTTNVWAAGDYYPDSSRSGLVPLIEHWNGSVWAPSFSPPATVGDSGNIGDLDASSTTDAWAAGANLRGAGGILALHWDGKSWTQVAAPSPGNNLNFAQGVADVSPTNAWMVGYPLHSAVIGTPGPAWVEHWDGTSWTMTPTPGFPAVSELRAVRGLSATDVWAVGSVDNASGNPVSPLIVHYDGTSWTVMPGVPSPGASSVLNGIAVTSTGALAVGSFTDASGSRHPLMLRWDGTTWTQIPTVSPGDSAGLTAVDGTSNNYWAVGFSLVSGGSGDPLPLHCC